MNNINQKKRGGESEPKLSFTFVWRPSAHFQTVTSNGNNKWFKATVYVDMLTLY